jgi:hypothetical protein
MDGKLLAQLAWVALRDADALQEDPDAFAEGTSPQPWGGSVDLTEEERKEVDRLKVLADRLFYRARCQGFTQSGTDAVFARARFRST